MTAEQYESMMHKDDKVRFVNVCDIKIPPDVDEDELSQYESSQPEKPEVVRA